MLLTITGYLLQWGSGQTAMLLLLGLILLPTALTYFPPILAITSLCLLGLMQTPLVQYDRVSLERNFFGVVSVVDRKNDQGDVWRFYVNGAGVHGAEQLNSSFTGTQRNLMFINTVKQLAAVSNFVDVALVGSGPGMALCLGGAQKNSVIYEIDPLAHDTADKYFSYQKECGQPVWHMGDGRLELGRDSAARYDLIIIDAFSGGSIPSHLLTREALAVYRSRLKPEGLIIFNTNNMYYDLSLPLSALAQDAHLQAWRFHSVEKTDLLHGIADSNWVLLAADGQDMTKLVSLGWNRLQTATDFPVWRDDLANLLAALKFMQSEKKCQRRNDCAHATP